MACQLHMRFCGLILLWLRYYLSNNSSTTKYHLCELNCWLSFVCVEIPLLPIYDWSNAHGSRSVQPVPLRVSARQTIRMSPPTWIDEWCGLRPSATPHRQYLYISTGIKKINSFRKEQRRLPPPPYSHCVRYITPDSEWGTAYLQRVAYLLRLRSFWGRLS